MEKKSKVVSKRLQKQLTELVSNRQYDEAIQLLRQFGIRKKSKELQLCRSFSMYWQSLRLVVKETICRECGAEVDEEVVYRAVA